MPGILIRISEDSCGNLLVRPVRDDWARRFRDVVVDNGGPRSLNVFFNQGAESAGILEGLSGRQRRELDRWGEITVRMDAWEAGHLYGYDAHTAAE